MLRFVLPSLALLVLACAAPQIAAQTTATTAAAAPDTRGPRSVPAHAPQIAHAQGVVHINGAAVPYDTEVAENIVNDASGHPGAQVLTIAYLRNDARDTSHRPILFAFNGGPGASSSPLHMEAMGPMLRGHGDAGPVENASSPLDAVDLVFIDPVSTGFSRPFDGVDPKQWYTFRGDALEVSGVIRAWLAAHHREASPRYLVGESYGTYRAGFILKYDPTLHFDGVALVSGGGTRTGPNADEINEIAAMAAGAWFHNKIDRAGRSVEQFYAEARHFAQTDYAAALALGDALPAAQKHAIAARLSTYIGLPADLIESHNLRLDRNTYMFNLLKDQGLRTGLLDSRATSALSPNAQGAIDDPALGVTHAAPGAPPMTPAAIGPVPSPGVGAYLTNTLHYATDLVYFGVNFTANSQWTWDRSEETTAVIVARALHADPHLRLMAVSGLYDLGGSDNSGFEQAGAPAGQLTLFQTPGPHQVYDGDDNRRVFNDAIRHFVAPH